MLLRTLYPLLDAGANNVISRGLLLLSRILGFCAHWRAHHGLRGIFVIRIGTLYRVEDSDAISLSRRFSQDLLTICRLLPVAATLLLRSKREFLARNVQWHSTGPRSHQLLSKRPKNVSTRFNH